MMRSLSDKTPIPLALIPDHAALPGSLESEDLTFSYFVRVIRKRWQIVLWTTLLCGLLALAFAFIQRPYYSTTATLEIEKQQSDPLDGAIGQLASSVGGSDDSKIEIQTQVSVLQSEALAIKAMERMHFESHQKSRWFPAKDTNRKAAERGLPLRQAPVTRERLLSIFSSHLKVTSIPDTRLITVVFEDPDPVFAAKADNTLIGQYVEDRFERRNGSTVQASEWMANQIADLHKEVEGAEQRLIDYQRKSGLIVSPGSSTPGPTVQATTPSVSSPALDRLMQVNKDLLAARELRITRGVVYMLAKTGDVNALADMGEGTPSGTPGDPSQSGMFNGLETLRAQQVGLKLQLSTALETYGTKNPHLVELDTQLAELDRQTKDEVARIVNRAGLDYQLAQKAEAGIQKVYNTEQLAATKDNDAEIRLAVLQQEAASTSTLYQDLFTKLQESKLSIGTQASNVAIIGSALPPAEAAHPKRLLDIAIGLALGLFCGAILTFVLDSMDDSVVTRTQVEELTSLPVLGSIPRFERALEASSHKTRSDEAAQNTLGGGAWVNAEPTSQPAEAYRALRTTLLLSQAGSPPKIMLITSPLPGEGKSTTIYNLAACYANFGTRVLIIDADLRRPSLHRFVHRTHRFGLSNLLTSDMTHVDVILKDPVNPNLSVLTAGPVPPNPAELLSSATFATLLKTLTDDYDLILIDSPPVLLVTDSIIMSSVVDGIVIILRSGSTKRAAIEGATVALRRSRASLFGVVLNGINTKSSEYYYAYGYKNSEYFSKDGYARTEA